jgi:hypothetical protein
MTMIAVELPLLASAGAGTSENAFGKTVLNAANEPLAVSSAAALSASAAFYQAA